MNRMLGYTAHTPIAIIGGGTGGLNAAAQILLDGLALNHEIRVFEPKRVHYYQPGWTMVGMNWMFYYNLYRGRTVRREEDNEIDVRRTSEEH